MNKHNGISLLEILVSMLLGAIIIGATVKIYISTIEGSADTVKSARLNYDLESAMQFMVSDIRRAGYWSGAVTGSDAINNPFTQGDANITITDITGGAGNNCLLYSYDGETQNGTADTNEFYGFKLESNTIKIRYAVASTASASIPCNQGSWETILDSDTVRVTALSFSAANSSCLNTTTNTAIYSTCAAAITATTLSSGQTASETREIAITLTGELVDDSNVSKTLTGIVKVRNNRIFIAP